MSASRRRLSPARQRILDFIIDYVLKNNGVSPTYFEIAAGVGLKSQATVHAHIEAMEACGWLTRKPWTVRSIELVLDPAEGRRRRVCEILDKIIADTETFGYEFGMPHFVSDGPLLLTTVRHVAKLAREAKTLIVGVIG